MIVDDPRATAILVQALKRSNPAARTGYVEPLLRECLAISEKTRPDDWRTFEAQALLGEALLGQEKYGDAEPYLRRGYEEMKQREKAIPAQYATALPETLDQLIELEMATNRPDEVRKWRAERARYPGAQLRRRK
jgi:hypothetical protein